jgi:hypothetical protein
MSVPNDESSQLVKGLSLRGYGLFWIDIGRDMRELRLEFIAGPNEPSHLIQLLGVSEVSFILQPGDQPPYTVVDAALVENVSSSDVGSDGPMLRFHVEGEAVLDVLCAQCIVYSEHLS